MKRSGEPKRRVPLLPGKPPRRSALRTQPRTSERDGESDRKPRPGRARRSRIRDSRLQQFHEAVGHRARGRCEAMCAPDCTGNYAEAHHVVTRGRGRGWPWLHDADRNGLGCCTRCHDWIHRPPASAFVELDGQRPFGPAGVKVSLPKLLGLIQSRPATDADPGSLRPRLEAARAEVSHRLDTA